MKVIIIDDEPLARGIVREYLQSFPEMEIVAECSDGFEGIKAIQQSAPDLVFLDVQMPKINGFEMLELLDEMPAVIFTTAFEEYALKAFESEAVDYLLKPFSKERFMKAIQRWQQQTAPDKQAVIQLAQQQAQQQNRIVVKDGSKIRIIPFAQIHYLESADDYVKIHTADGVFLKNKTMSFFESVLPADQFVRIHRSYLVQVSLITRIDPYEKESHLVVLRVGVKLPASRSGYTRLKEVLGL
jgi:two-component system LytT family response regulator